MAAGALPFRLCVIVTPPRRSVPSSSGYRYFRTVTVEEMPTFPEGSYALHCSACVPLATFPLLFHLVVNGSVVELPFKTESTYSSTRTTFTLSEVLTVTVRLPETVAPSIGEVMLTDGEVVSGAL